VDISGFEILKGGIFVLLIGKHFIYKQLKQLNDGFTIYVTLYAFIELVHEINTICAMLNF